MSDRRMFRYEVPVDDQPHEVSLTGSPVAVAAPDLGTVEFWAECEHGAVITRAFRVFATGQPLPDGARWAGTCPRIRGIVWHLYDVTSCGEASQ